MTAATTPASGSAPRRKRHGVRIAVLAVFALIAAVLAPVLAATPATPAARAAAAAGSVSVSIAAASPQLGPGQDLQASVTLTNASTQEVDAGQVDLVLDRARLGSRDALEDWYAADAAGPLPEGPTVSAAVPRLQPAGTVVLALTIPSAEVGLAASLWGVRGLVASYRVGGQQVAQGRNTITWYAGEPVQPTPLALALPMTTPPTTTGLLSAEDLSGLTRPGGLLTRELDGIAGQPVALGIDPMIIASIRALGSRAPESATAWLDQLAALPAETFPLAYADADLSAQSQAGLPALLAPTSLAYAMDAADFPAGPTQPATPTPNATPTPTATASIPSLDDLLAWRYTGTAMAWPPAGAVAPSDPAAFAAAGLTTTIVSSNDVSAAPTVTPRASAQAGDARLALSDARLASALHRAETAGTDAEWRAAIDEAAAVLAVAAQEDDGGAVLAALDRGWPPTANRLPDTLTAVAALPWATSVPLSAALATPATPVALAEGGEGAERITAVQQLSAGESRVAAFSTALADPTVVTGPQRSSILGLLGVGWRTDTDGWTTALANHAAADQATLDSVSVAPSSDVLVVGSPTHIPVSVKNAFSAPVNVTIRAVPSNGRLVVDTSVDAAIPAGSSATVNIPVSSQIGSGDVQLTVSVFSPTGVQLGAASTIGVNVQADWEGLGASIVGGLIVILFGAGLWRTIVRRRRARVDSDDDADGAPDAGASTTTQTPDPEENRG